MAIEAIEHYLHGILTPTLKDYGVSEDFTKQIIDTAGTQIYSCIRHWADLSFRKTLLLIGSEEGPFYEPAGKSELKCFVVVTIRNSPFETVQSKNYAQAGLPAELSDDKVKSVTKGAIAYFNRLDFTALSKEAQQDEHFDIYGKLAEQYSVSWKALQQLAGTPSKKIEYAKVPFERPFTIDGIKLTNIDDTKSFGSVLDGYSSEIDLQLSTALYNIATEGGAFATDCFKMVTRNIEKLLRIMEFLLTHNCAFVTSNYYIENGYIERRIQLIKAASRDSEAIEHFRQTTGLGYKHAAVLKNVYLQLTKPNKQ